LMFYVMYVSQDGKYYGPPTDNQASDPRYQSQSWEWQGEGFTNSQFTNFNRVGPLQAPCGYFVVYGAQVIEDDAFLGTTDMGTFVDGFQLLHQRIPLGWGQSETGVHHFQGVSYDGSYDYAMQYTFNAEIKSAGAPTPIVETTAEQPSALAVDRSRLAISEETESRLPDTYLSANERLTFRHLADDWTVVEPADGRIPISYTILPTVISPSLPSESASTVHIYDPVHIIETVARENYDNLEVADIFAAYINKTGVAGTALHPSEPTEIQLGERTALLWQPATEDAHTWLAFRALDRSVNIVQFAMSTDEFAADQLNWFSFAESLDYQAPSRRLDEIEKSLRQFIAGTAIGDYETVEAVICRRNRQTTDMVTGLFGAIFDVDIQGLTNAFLSFSSGWTELDTSSLFFETIESSDTAAKVMISGVVTLNGENGRETVTFRRFNMTGRNIYRLEQDAGEWFVCD
ncbi:MAG: hypothetical protein KDE31_24515, partial [Caldilineaceae bacterium]|nr:hypothetical protein [Caldilineaceae bacterium]